MYRYLAAACIVGFWAVMMGMLLEREVLPAWRSARMPVYRRADQFDHLPRRSRLGIYFNRRRVGTAESITRRDTDGTLVIEGTVHLSAEVPILRFRSRLMVRSEVRVGADGQLQRFSIHATAPGISRTITGKVVGREMVLTSTFAGRRHTERVPFEPRDLLAHDLSAMTGLGRLRVGQRWFIQNINPLTGRCSLVPVEVRRKETIHWRGREVEAFLVVSVMDWTEIRTWVSPSGEVLRQELPLGLVLEREPPPTGEQKGRNEG